MTEPAIQLTGHCDILVHMPEHPADYLRSWSARLPCSITVAGGREPLPPPGGGRARAAPRDDAAPGGGAAPGGDAAPSGDAARSGGDDDAAPGGGLPVADHDVHDSIGGCDF
eukprot:2544177-Pyramimonas_sp.AAC.1